MDTKSDDSLDKSLQQKCVVDDTKFVESGVRNEMLTTTSTAVVTEAAAVAISTQRKTDLSGSVNAKVAAAINTSGSNSSDIRLSDSPDSSPPSGTNFDRKVKQISKDLKETTLAEPGDEESNSSSTTHNAGDTISTTITSSSSSSTTSSPSSSSSPSTVSTTPEDEQNSLVQRDEDGDAILQDESPEDDTITHVVDGLDSFDERSKKVRFHPDAKANDGGNRVKKKKLKTSPSELEGAVGGLSASEVCGMDLDEDEDDDDDSDEDVPIDEDQSYEEEEFDLAKTIAEAEDYLKQHPLTFVSPNEQTGERLKDGLLDIEDMPQLAESSEDEDLYANVQPENNVQRVLGRQVKGGQVEFLLRYADRPGLFWESEDFIQKQCPSMLTLYERHREKRQDRLMRHVAKRQNLRQRYTDF